MTFLSMMSCTSQNKLVEIEDHKKRYKISIPENWKTEEDQESSSWYMEHPILNEKYTLSVQWNESKGFVSDKELDDFIIKYGDLSEVIRMFNTEIVMKSKGCKVFNTLQVCRMDSRGVDIESNAFISSDYYISHPTKAIHLLLSVRVSKKEFDEHEKELTKQILESVVFL
ncbi:hypothetical protein GCM10022393_24830 [Aquimarina addita]|uniref:Lipoprotein n=2 Tax=Aquimarina addita TaxID=870485 RepID=A0ABP6UMV4_9FLAO